MFSREIRAEYIEPKIRRFWKRQPPVDNGEQPVRTRLGLDERRAQTKLRPHSEHIVSIQGRKGGENERV